MQINLSLSEFKPICYDGDFGFFKVFDFGHSFLEKFSFSHIMQLFGFGILCVLRFSFLFRTIN